MPTGIYPRTIEHKKAIGRGLLASTKKIGRPIGIPLTDKEKAQRGTTFKGHKHTDAAKSKISANRMGQLRGVRTQPIGYRHSSETRSKITAAQTGHPWSEAKRQKHKESSVLRRGLPRSIGEQRVVEGLRSQGCEVLRRGWPDLLVVEADGRIRAIEVKALNGKPTIDQKRLFQLLQAVGLKVEIVYESNERKVVV